ncbi:MAG: type II secretion system protein [Sulfuricella sp.]|nr:type II secretion system protein [Sulfuricella sp.]
MQRGFTLVEAIIVIVIAGVLAGMVAMFIRLPVQGYLDSAARADLTDVADTALRRMSRDLRLALPNSVRVSGGYVEFLLTSAGGRYLADEDNPTAGNILDFATATNLTFDVVGPMPAIAAGDSIVVYNLGPGMSPADAYCASATGCNNRAVVSAAAAPTVTLAANPFAAQSPSMASPERRFQVVTTPVTYACVGGALTRYAGYAIQAAQPTDVAAAPLSAASSAILAAGVTGCTFSYANLPNVRGALVGLGLTLQNANAETVALFHQVHVDNTP